MYQHLENLVARSCEFCWANICKELKDISPEVESVENKERVSEKFGGVAGVLARVMKAKGEPKIKKLILLKSKE